MNKGKVTCEALKAIRQQIADANGIPYTPCECNFEGECIGTCPNCERERQYIESQLSKKHQSGKALKIIGVAAGVTAMLACQEAKAEESTTDSLQQKFEWDFNYFGMMGIAPRPEIEAQWEDMKEFISLFPNDTFLIVGHTDERGSLKYNLKLSQKRADYLRTLLVNENNSEKIKCIGVASTEPIIPNAQTKTEHEHNRRTTLEFYSKKRYEELEKKIKRISEDNK